MTYEQLMQQNKQLKAQVDEKDQLLAEWMTRWDGYEMLRINLEKQVADLTTSNNEQKIASTEAEADREAERQAYAQAIRDLQARNATLEQSLRNKTGDQVLDFLGGLALGAAGGYTAGKLSK